MSVSAMSSFSLAAALLAWFLLFRKSAAPGKKRVARDGQYPTNTAAS
jgi:hypothetical protein